MTSRAKKSSERLDLNPPRTMYIKNNFQCTECGLMRRTRCKVAYYPERNMYACVSTGVVVSSVPGFKPVLYRTAKAKRKMVRREKARAVGSRNGVLRKLLKFLS